MNSSQPTERTFSVEFVNEMFERVDALRRYL